MLTPRATSRTGSGDMLYTPADAPLDQKSQTDARFIQGENCARTCNQTRPVLGDLIFVHIAVAEGYTLQGAAVTVNGVKLDMERNITYAGSDTQAKLVFGMPQEDATIIITPVKKQVSPVASSASVQMRLFFYKERWTKAGRTL